MKITNKLGLPEQLVKAISRKYDYKMYRYSVTNLLSPLREMILKRRYNTHEDYTMDVSDTVSMLIGNGVHRELEYIDLEEHQLAEKRYEAPFIVNGFIYILSGIIDYIDTKLELVADYKTCSAYAIVFGSNNEKWKKQLQYGAYLHWVKTGNWFKKGQIIAIIKDWKESEVGKSNYPTSPYQVLEFYLGDVRDIEQELQAKFVEIYRLEKLADDELPICTVEERWGTPNKYAVMLKGKKRAVKLHESELEAQQHAKAIGGFVQFRKGSDRKCEKYCGVNKFCKYWRETYEKK